MNLLVLVGVGFFLLLVGALLGRYYVPDRRPLKRAAEEGRSYVRSLVEVLDGRQDAAIGEIKKALRDNTKTIDAYFALGTLFRHRGEHERAVRVHQTLLLRRDMDKKTRLRVHRQLALDFEAAGFHRRAVKALEYVVAKDKKNVEAFVELSKLYEQTGAWERAAAVQRRVGKISKKDTSKTVAHLFAQQANVAIEQQQQAVARKALRRALSADAKSVHALHVLALYQQSKKNHGAAAKAWQKALETSPELAAFFVPPLRDALFEQGKVDVLDKLLHALMESHPDNVHLQLAFARLEAARNPDRALALLTELLEQRPHLLPARREAARLTLQEGNPEAIRNAFEETLEMMDRADRGYRCRACGYAARELFWRCPSCHAWESVGVAWGRRAGEKARSRK